MSSPEPIAIIGTACRFPGGSDTPSKLWELLREPRDVLQKVPSKRRWNPEAFFHEDPEHHGTSNVQTSYFLDNDPADFDNNFFNIQPAEAEAIDPQQRMLIETVYESLCTAGQTIEGLRGSQTAIIVGAMGDDWSGALYKDWEALPQYAATGTGRSIMSNRLSYFFDWHGASITLDTACSSSLVAVHLGIQAIRNGESRVAVAAGTNLILTPALYLAESNLHMVSTSGRSKMWDRDVDGYGRGEGVAAVVLKSLSAALEDGDHIECIIRATGVNQDGKTSGMTMPNALAQAALIRDTYTRAGLDIDKPEDRPQFFHAHGTGTPAGDPREAEAISRAFYSNGAEDKLRVGSIKTIIGHTEGTAGLASLIGSVLAVQHGIIPPNMHFNNLNPEVAPFYDHLEVPTTAKPWPKLSLGQPRRASVNSFGFGGTNAHAIIESYEPGSIETSTGPLFTPLTVSAATGKSLRELLPSYSSYLKANPDVSLRDFAYTLQERRSTLAYRAAVSASTTEEAVQKIDALLNDAEAPEFHTKHFGVATPRILGVFTGQGAQWPRMGAKLVEMSPFAAKRLEELDAVLASLPQNDRPGWTLREELLADAKTSRVYEATLSQPLCTAVQILLVDLLQLAGIKFHAVVGHSSGEIAAAYAAGLLSARAAIVTAYYRGYYTKLAKSPNGVKGAMLAVGTSFEDASDFCQLDTLDGRIQIAAQNSSSSITLTGDEDAVDEAAEIFKDEGKFARKLRVDIAYHSAHMLPCAAPYIASVEALSGLGVPTTGSGPIWHSSVHKGKIMSADDVNPQYWVDNLISPVRFAPAMTEAARQSGPFDLALEVGPHPALKGPCLDTLEEASGDRVPYSGVLARGKDDAIEISNALGLVWSRLGAGSVSFETFEKAVSGQAAGRYLIPDLPNYPWDHSRKYWTLSRLSGFQMNAQTPPNPLLGRRCVDRETSDKIQWRNMLRPKEIGWLKSHQLQGQIVFPASGYISMAVEAITAVAGESEISLIQVENLIIDRAIPFADDNFVIESLFMLEVLRSTNNDIKADFSLYCGNPYDGSKPMTLHASGNVSATFGEPQADKLPFVKTEEFNMSPIDVKRFYGQFEPIRYQYTPPFRGVRSIKRKDGFATGTLEDQTGSVWEDQLLIHPAMLDCAFQTGFAAWCCPGDGKIWRLHMPSRIRSITINPYFTPRGTEKQRIFPWECGLEIYKEGWTTQDTTVFSEDNAHTFIQIQGLDATPFSAAKPEDDLPLFSRFDYRVDRPNGDVAAVNDPPVLEVTEDVIESDRLALYYLRHLTETITPEEKANTLPHYQHVLNWASHVVEDVKSGQNKFLPPSCLDDTKERFKTFLDENGHRVDIRLIQSVGEHLPEVIRARSSILEHMTKDDMLDNIYEEGLGLDQPNRYMARMAAQVGHRYPRMHVFEIGAGTGGSTRFILPMLGESFSTYTYTDISSGFFEAAQERFKDYASRMIYKTYNMEGSPAAQGFVEGSYDLVLASYALHATDELEQMMTNIRSLLKPGGYVIIQEIISNDVLRINLPMSGLPGWWAGAENGRPWGPALSLPQWDNLVRKCGFAGIDSISPQNHILYPDAVFVGQAVDDRVKLLRSPLSSIAALPPATTPQLIIVGGETIAVHRLAEELASLLAPRYSKLVRVSSFQDLNTEIVVPSSTVVVLSELDEPVMKSPTPEKHEALKALWREAGMVLWVCQGARAETPHSFMTVGLGRCVRYEYPNITLQIFDLDKLDSGTHPMLAEELMRLESLTFWEKEVHRQELLWSIEPEVYMESGVRMIPRLSPYDDANKRYNAARRTITKDVNPQKSTVLFASHGSSCKVQCGSPLRLPTPPPVSGETRTIRISHFLLQTIDLASAGRFMLCVGTDEGTGDKVLALSHSPESPVPVLADWTVPLGEADPVKALAAVAAHIVASNIFKMVPKGSTLLVHEPDDWVASVLVKQAQDHSIQVAITTSLKGKIAKGWQYIHRQLPHRYAVLALPASLSVFIDMSPSPASAEAGQLIAECIPESCATYNLKTLFGSRTEFRPGSSPHEVADLFKAAWLAVSKDQSRVGDDVPVIPLNEISNHSAIGEHPAVVNCSGSLITANVQAIDSGVIFRPDKTYFLVGLAAEVGQSICQWMVKHGARYVVMTSRRPKVHPKFLQSLEALGAVIKVLPCDVTKRDSLRKCYEEICQTMPPIAGVANGAMALRDALFDKMSFEELTAVLNPKVIGTQLLDELFYNIPLDFFIVFSSLTCIVGNSGQSNYTCANMYMVALTAQRKKRGLAGSAMGMSSLIGLGFVERSEELDEDYFAKLGHKNISETDLHEQFAEAIIIGRPDYTENAELTSGMIPIYADAQVKARWRTDIRFNHFVMERPGSQTYAGQVVDVPVRVKLAEAKKFQEASTLIKESFVARLNRIMMIAQDDQVNEKASLVEQGIDSLMAVEIRTWFLKELEVDIPVLKIISGGSILDLLAHALENIPKSILDVDTLEAGENAKPAAVALSKPASRAPPVQISASLESTEGSSDNHSSPKDTPSRSTTPLETPPTEIEEPVLINPTKAQGKEVTSRMSFGQERFWFLDGYLEDKKTFNMAMMFKLTGKLQVARVEEAVQTVAQRHESLRTRFFWSGEGGQRVGVQGVLSESPVHLVSKSIGSKAEVDEELQKMYEHVWDLGSWETVKISLLSLSDDVHYLLCGAHHISLDGYSLSLLFVELEFAYSGRALPPVGPGLQCRSFATEQRNRYEMGAMNTAVEYYRGIVSPDLKPVDLFPFAKSQTRPVLDHYGHFEAQATIEPSLASKIKQLARKNRSTPFHLYLAALQALVFRLIPDMNEFFVGIADANRMDNKYIYSLGFFLNLLPLRFTRGASGTKISDIIPDARNKAYAALQHSDVPFDVLLHELKVPRSNTHTPIFQVFVDYRQVYQERELWGGCKTSDEKWCSARTGYDVALEITENRTGESLLSIRLQEGLYSKSSTELFLRSYLNVLETFAKGIDIAVDDLPCWDPKDIEKAFEVGKGPELRLEWPATISHRVDQMIEKHSTKPALKDGLSNSLTYGEMGARVNTIAMALIAAGAAAKTPVAVFQDPSADWICSMLAIFRVGATYIPLDLRNSVVRLISIVKASQPAIVLTDRNTTMKTKLIRADQATEINTSEIATSMSLSPLPNNAKPELPAVILFTSGSTGEPKGVIMNHSNLAAECEAYSKSCDLPAGNAVVMQQSIFSFDFSIEQTFVALADGGCLYVVPADKRGDPQEISKLMVEQGVTYTSGTPSEYEMLFKYASETLAKCKTWRYAFGGGEYLSPGLIREFAKLPLPNLRLFNNYGPAEVTTAALKGELKYRDTELEEHTIAGFILPNYRLYFVDRDLQPVPIGVPGEIVVGGPGVTAGYLGAEEMTRAHYIPDKFNPSAANGRLYRTGDRGHLREDGAVYWDSRIEGDTQVKLRGFRVELTEVEAVLVKHSDRALSHAAVTLRGAGEDRFLAAHVVFVSDYPQEKRQDLIKTLETSLPLPQYMRPSVIIPLADKPLTAHWKLDRKAIQAMPLPDAGVRARKSNSMTETEKKLAGLWQMVVPHEIGEELTPDTNFFNVGGNSLLLVKLQALVKRTLGSAPRLIDLMNTSTLAEMSTAIEISAKAHAIDWEAETRLPESLRRPSEQTATPPPKKRTLTVILAGATGYLGRHLLPRLVESPQVREVLCLVRNGSLAPTSLQSGPKVRFIAADLSQPNLGLSEAAFAALAQMADVVVDCAANRAFWDSYETLKPVNFEAVKGLVRLAHANKASFHLLSSGTVQIYEDTTPPADGTDGYVASKWAAESFLRKASASLRLAVNIHRPVSTPKDLIEESSKASAKQALDGMVNLTLTLGKKPDFGGVSGYLDLVPVDEVTANICTSIVNAASRDGGVEVVAHRGKLRVYTRDFANYVENDVRLKDLPAMNSLDWFGEVKKAGFDLFMTSQHLVMRSKSGELVSRR